MDTRKIHFNWHTDQMQHSTARIDSVYLLVIDSVVSTWTAKLQYAWTIVMLFGVTTYGSIKESKCPFMFWRKLVCSLMWRPTWPSTMQKIGLLCRKVGDKAVKAFLTQGCPARYFSFWETRLSVVSSRISACCATWKLGTIILPPWSPPTVLCFQLTRKLYFSGEEAPCVGYHTPEL